MLKKFLAAILLTAASFSFTATTDAAEVDSTCRGGCYGSGCYNDGYCYGNDYSDNDNRGNYHGGCYGGRGACRQ